MGIVKGRFNALPILLTFTIGAAVQPVLANLETACWNEVAEYRIEDPEYVEQLVQDCIDSQSDIEPVDEEVSEKPDEEPSSEESPGDQSTARSY